MEEGRRFVEVDVAKARLGSLSSQVERVFPLPTTSAASVCCLGELSPLTL